MKLDVALFVAVIALCGLTVTALLIPEVPGSHGRPHPEYPSMFQGGGDATARHGDLLWLGWGIGVLEILILVGCMALGASRGGQLHGLDGLLALGVLIYVAVWTWLVVAYGSSGAAADGADPPLYLALPGPTALMMYVVWPVPLIFVFYFVFGFRRWVLSEEDQRRFRRLVAHRGARVNSHRMDAGEEK